MKPLTWISTISALAISVGLMGISRVTKQNVTLSKSGLLPSSQINSQLDTAKAIAHTAYAQLPLYFETNQGQTNDQVKFLSRGNGYTLFLTPTEAVLALQQSVIGKQQSASKTLALDLPASESEVQSSGTILRMRLVGANPTPRIAGLDQLPGKSNYLLGDDAEKWRTNIPTYAKVKYEDVYPGVDLIYYGNQRQLEYDFVVAPGANPQIITFGFEAADKLEVDARGDLVLHTTGGQIKLHKPLVYQEMDGARQEIFGSYVLLGSRDSELRTHEVGFEVAAYDSSKFLVIDPILSYSTYLGGSYSTFGGNNTDEGVGIGVDSSGNAYVAGITSSTDFPTVNPLQAVHQGGSPFPFDVFVTKLNAEGSAILYSTYLGGVGSDRALGFAVDASGNAYVAGETSSVNFPTINPLQSTYRGGFDGFAAKLNPEGSGLLWSTYLGGSAQDASFAISADIYGNAYVTGLTSSSDFPTVNAFQPNLSSFTYEPFVTKFNPTGSPVYSTYLGGSSEDAGRGIAADTSGNAYVTGYTFSSDFPTANAIQPALSPHPSGALDAFVTKLNPTGSALVYSTFLGGSFSEHGNAIAVDSSGNAYVTGFTNSTNFPTVNPLQPTLLGGQDAFVLKINPAGSALVYSSYLGGSGFDRTFSIAVDSSGNAHLTGFTRSNDFPVVDPLQGTIGGGGSPCAPFEFQPCDDAFVAKLNPAGSALVYSTYLGGNDEDRGNGIAVDQAGHAYVTGYTRSSNFPTVNPVQPTLGGFRNAFVAKIEPTGGTNPPPTANAQSVATQEDTSLTITLEATSPAAIPLTFSIVTPPTKGSLNAITDLSCTEGDCTASVIYTPNTDFNGSDSFTFKANDAFADSAPATVSITVDAVNDAPAANPDSAIATTTSVTISVLDNDTDVEGDALSVLSVTQGGNGAVSFDAATITYTLTVYFSGTDSFTYVVSDGHGGTGTATVTITVSVPASSGVNLVSSQVASLNLGGGQATGLTSTLQVAQHSLVNGNRTSAINQLNAFINQVEALKLSGQLAPPLADSLIAQAQALINGI